MIAVDSWAKSVVQCINDAEQGLLVDAPNQVVTGFAGDKLTGLIQRLARLVEKDYLEVGVFQGSSLLNTAFANPKIHCYGIDNYSQHDPGGKNRGIVLERAKALSVDNFSLIDKDFEDGLQEFDKEIGVYFIDGPHDYRSQLMCLGYATKFLARYGIILVDDANYPHVRQATKDFLAMFPEYKLVFEAYTNSHPINMDDSTKAHAKKGWWDGVHLIVHDPDNLFEGLVPPTPPNVRFIRDHYIHATRYAPLATEAVLLVQSLPRFWQLPKAVVRLFLAWRQRRAELRLPYEICNTESEDLPTRQAKLRQLSS